MINPEGAKAKDGEGKLTCEDTRDLLYLFTCNELEDDEAKQVADHLAGCPDCRKALAEHVKVSGSLKRSMPEIELRYYSKYN